MRSLALIVLSCALCFAVSVAFAQSSDVKLCVAEMQIAGSSSFNAAGGQLLMKALTKEKPDKVLSTVVVPVPVALPADALAAAKQHGCNYVLTTNQAEVHAESSWWGSSTAGVNMQTYYVTTEYRLRRVGDDGDVIGGSFKAADKGSEQNAIGATMKKVADSVTQAIRKAGPVTASVTSPSEPAKQ